MIGVSYDKPKSLRDFKDKYNLPFNFLSDRDKKVAKIFGANGLIVPKRMSTKAIIKDEYFGLRIMISPLCSRWNR